MLYYEVTNQSLTFWMASQSMARPCHRSIEYGDLDRRLFFCPKVLV